MGRIKVQKIFNKSGNKYPDIPDFKIHIIGNSFHVK